MGDSKFGDILRKMFEKIGGNILEACLGKSLSICVDFFRSIPRATPKDALNTLKLGLSLAELSNLAETHSEHSRNIVLAVQHKHLSALKRGSKRVGPRFHRGRVMVGRDQTQEQSGKQCRKIKHGKKLVRWVLVVS